MKGLLNKVHGSEAGRTLLSKLPEKTRVGLGVTSKNALTRVADVYMTGVFKKVGVSLTRIKKAGKVGIVLSAIGVFTASPAIASEGALQTEMTAIDPVEIESFVLLRPTAKDADDACVVEAIIDTARNALADTILDEQRLVREAGVETGHFVQSSFNPIGLIPIVGDRPSLEELGLAKKINQRRQIQINFSIDFL